jgi:hypothetical protein
MRTRLAVATGLLAAAGAACWLGLRGGSVAIRSAGAPDAPESTTIDPPALRTPDDRASSREPRADPASPPAAATAVTVTGRIDGSASGGRAWIVAGGRVVASGPIEKEGSFSLCTSATGEEAELLVALDGRLAQRAKVKLEGAPAVRFSSPDGLTFSGRVLRPDGKPARSLEVRLVRAWSGSCSTPVAWTAIGDTVGSREIAPLVTQPRDFAITVTDRDGRFTFEDLPPDFYAVASGDPWFFLESITGGTGVQILAPSSGAEPLFVVHPAERLVAEVVDGLDGKPIPAFEGHVRDAVTGMFVAFGGEAGRLDVAFARWWDGDEPSLDLDVDAKGYEPRRLSGIRRTAPVRVVMTPVATEDVARVVFEILDAAGKPIDARWRVRIVDPKDADKTLREVDLETKDASHVEAAVAPGRWTFLVSTGEGLGYLRWLGERDVVRGSVSTVRCTMAPYGSLRVDLPASLPQPDGGPYLALFPSSGVGSQVPAHGDTYRAPALPEGDYRLEYQGADGVFRRKEKPVRIRAGEETVVSFRDP